MTRLPAALVAATALAAIALARARGDEVANSPHNLSALGPGPVKAANERQICIFCHAPHTNTPQSPLWNRRDPGVTYTTYTSSTMKVTPGQPSGASRQCLSCHDGTIALGEVASRRKAIEMAGGVQSMPAGHGRLGTDLSDAHPISFPYAAAQAANKELLGTPSVAGRPPLDPNGAVQCTSCHDPHDNKNGAFLREKKAFSALCTSCHNKEGWTQSAHATSSSTWSGHGQDPWPGSKLRTVAENGCESCHVSHRAGGRRRLLRYAADEANCLTCHNGNVATHDIASELGKWTAHPVGAAPGVHDAAEAPDGRATHVTCVDCHEPHHAAADPAGSTPSLRFSLRTPLAGASGLSATGSPVPRARLEHEVCLKCHADDRSTHRLRIQRVIDQPNHRLRFLPENPSYHPVEAPVRALASASLKTPLTPGTMIGCTDCHSSDDGPGAGGNGPAGPHGSRWDYLLERQYTTADQTMESPQAYALCYKCHERASILANQSFSRHQSHTSGDRAPCSACHDPHGIYQAQGNAVNNAHLMNFDVRIVKANRKGLLEYRSLGPRHGDCSLSCHGKDHDRLAY